MTTDLRAQTHREGDHTALNSGASNGSRASTGEMPVLFQVTDVSQPKGRRLQERDRNLVETNHRPVSKLDLAGTAAASSTSAEDANVLRLSEMAKPYTPAALEPATLWTPSVASLLDDPSLLAETAAATKPASEAKTEKPKGTAETAKESSPSAKAKASETVETAKNKDSASKEERREREANSRRPAVHKKDWFSTHGKLIAVGFVLALAATVVVARNKKQPATPQSEDSWAMKHPGDAADQLASDAPKIELPAVGGKKLPSDVQATSQPGETSPAAADKLVEKKPAKDKPADVGQVDLLPPTLPQQSLVETAPARSSPPTSLAPPLVAAPPAAMAEKPAGETVAPAGTDPLFHWPQRETQVATRPDAPAVTVTPNAPPAAANPGEVLNPYAAAKHAAGPQPASGPAATVAARSPYVLPNSRQDVPTTSPPASVYGAPASGGSNYTEAPNSGYAPASGYSPPPAYAPAPANTQAPGYSTGTQPSVYGPAPTTPSPYLPPAAAGGMPPQPGSPAAPAAPNYGAPPAGASQNGTGPMGTPNNPPTPGGYRYERTGSGLY